MLTAGANKSLINIIETSALMMLQSEIGQSENVAKEIFQAVNRAMVRRTQELRKERGIK